MSCCNVIDSHFAEKHADRDLRRYVRRGPDPTTALLIAALRAENLRQPSLMDIGAGIGVLQHELLPADVSAVTHVDASPAYLAAARSECAQRGNLHRVTFVEGDITEVADELARSDAVFLDRVVCCYPTYEDLIDSSTSRCRLLFAISYPRSNRFSRSAFHLDNLKRVIQRKPFRAYVHSNAEVESRIVAAGFEMISQQNSFLWRIVAFRKTTAI